MHGELRLYFFLVTRAVIHKEFVPGGKTVNSEFCLPVQQWLCKRISKARLQFREKGIWFLLHDNAPARLAMILTHFLANRGMVEITTHLNHLTSRHRTFSIPNIENDSQRKKIYWRS
jgi:hypothetical protein